MSFEKKPRHLANFSLAKEHGYLKKMQFTFCSNLKVQPFGRKHISTQLLIKPSWRWLYACPWRRLSHCLILVGDNAFLQKILLPWNDKMLRLFFFKFSLFFFCTEPVFSAISLKNLLWNIYFTLTKIAFLKKIVTKRSYRINRSWIILSKLHFFFLKHSPLQ